MPNRPQPDRPGAYGGPGWSPRTTSMTEEVGTVWAPCGIDSEYAPLRTVLLHRPGPELAGLSDPDRHLLLARPDPLRAARQHAAVADAYRENGVAIVYVDPAAVPPPNTMFCADLFVMTPAGAILGRPASSIRAGEERWIARRLADVGVPILRSVGGRGTFEGADLAWLTPDQALVGRGLRTNGEGARQVAATLAELGVDTRIVDLSQDTMHLMGDLRFLDRDLACVRTDRLPREALRLLEARGYEVRSLPDDDETTAGHAMNWVTLGPRKVLMPGAAPRTRSLLEEAGVECRTVATDELHKCAGSIGCLTGVLLRDRVKKA